VNSAPDRIENDKDVREYRAEIAQFSKRVQRQFKLAAIATASLLVCMFLTYLFLNVGPFHSHWYPYGKIALALTLAALIVALHYDVLAWAAWSISRQSKKEFKEFLEDRFGVTDK